MLLVIVPVKIIIHYWIFALVKIIMLPTHSIVHNVFQLLFAMRRRKYWIQQPIAANAALIML